jgi:signal peptidase II
MAGLTVAFSGFHQIMRLLLLLALLVPCVACDQATKSLAVTHLAGRGSIDVVDGFFRLIYAENPGAFLGLGRSLPEEVRVALFSVGVALMLLVLAVVLVKKRMDLVAALGLALLLAGGIGNLVDRVARPGGRVVDFAQLGVTTSFGTVRTGIFNVADVHIVVGALLVAAASLRRRPQEAGAPGGGGSDLPPAVP